MFLIQNLHELFWFFVLPIKRAFASMGLSRVLLHVLQALSYLGNEQRWKEEARGRPWAPVPWPVKLKSTKLPSTT
jgi:hypothetical protein